MISWSFASRISLYCIPDAPLRRGRRSVAPERKIAHQTPALSIAISLMPPEHEYANPGFVLLFLLAGTPVAGKTFDFELSKSLGYFNAEGCCFEWLAWKGGKSRTTCWYPEAISTSLSRLRGSVFNERWDCKGYASDSVDIFGFRSLLPSGRAFNSKFPLIFPQTLSQWSPKTSRLYINRIFVMLMMSRSFLGVVVCDPETRVIPCQFGHCRGVALP
jgi:hypothetical protein